MTDDNTFLELYERYRRKSQLDWYRLRYREYEKANRQAVDVSSVLLLLTTIVSLLAGAGFAREAGVEKLWALLAVVLPALSTAFAAYRGLYAFQEQSKLYRDAALTLQIARGQAPDFAPDGSRVEGTLDPEAYVLRVEEVFRLEQGQWGQIAAEIRPTPRHVRPGEEEVGGAGANGASPAGARASSTSPGEDAQPLGAARTEAETGGSTLSSPVDAPATVAITATTLSAESRLAAGEGGVAVLAAQEEPGLAPQQEPAPSPEEAPATGAEEPAADQPPQEERG
jgi:hypothetical protein